MNYTLYNKDCFDVFPEIPDGSVDLVLTDPPYGTTACKWDSVIPLELMWEQLKRVVKKNGAIVLTASQPFTSALVLSNPSMWKYEWVWEKEQGSMPMQAPYQPIKVHESLQVFSFSASTYSKRGSMVYHPQMSEGAPYKANQRKSGNMTFHTDPSGDHFKDNKGVRYPRSVHFCPTERGFHPTQKPVALMEYLIKTYTNEGETVLDFCIGSGTTGVACGNLNRRFIGIEKDTEHGYFQIAETRIAEAYSNTQTKESDT